MAVITDADRDWSTGVAISSDEVWQCRQGMVLISTEASPAENDGVLLQGRRGDAITISSGQTVKYKLASGTEGMITRTAV